jgi:hypothetical protein
MNYERVKAEEKLSTSGFALWNDRQMVRRWMTQRHPKGILHSNGFRKDS